MNILLISQCNKNALKETRRILDQFAERRGDRSWQTPITQAGLDTLRKLLRKTARKNTAVACHWIRGRNNSELLWIVGDAARFNRLGATPTNTTARNILRRDDENDWYCGEEIKLLATLAALLHDLGKACAAFQARLANQGPIEKNLYRHEWISLRLFQAFVGEDSDAEWLQRLIDAPGDQQRWLGGLEKDGLDSNVSRPFADGQLPPLAQAVGWLIVSHHRLPQWPKSKRDDHSGLQSGHLDDLLARIDANWNEPCDETDPDRIHPYWTFDDPLPVATDKWQQSTRRIAEQLLARLPNSPLLSIGNAYLMHLARLCLMLADHNYSSLSDRRHRDWVNGASDYPLNANTLRSTGEINQRLDAHLLGVARLTGRIVRSLPSMADHLPRLGHHPGFRKRTANKRFQWQNKAFELSESLRERSEQHGFFAINMASTGCGKTLANGRIMYALANPQKGARFNIALGLRTLTLQTGKALQERLGLSDSELTIRVGGSANRKLFEHYEREAEQSGSASATALLDDDSHITFEGDFEHHGLLQRLQHDPAVKALVAAPILTCTVDHLVPATEGTRGGRQIAPMLRLMSSDLVLDEIDDFDLADLPALTRLVHWAAMLGARILLSSATLPPALVEGLFNAYRDGRRIYQQNRGEPGAELNICCAWFDEHDKQHADCSNSIAFTQAHQTFVLKRHQRLAKADVRRRGELIPFVPGSHKPDEIRSALASLLQQQALQLHQQHHSLDPHGGKRVSFGLIRMANIEPMVDVALALFQQGAPSGVQIHLCVYHSQYPLLLRSRIEHLLDTTLDRRVEMAVFELPEIRRKLEQSTADDQLFIVLGSPVTEVGRDHDYDWAIVEPSSMRSLIQLAGRIRRHRPAPCDSANLKILSNNLKAKERPNQPAFCKPGFESDRHRLNNHDLRQLLTPEQWQVIDARPRIVPAETLQPCDNLVDLEHHRLQRLMLGTPMATPREDTLSTEAIAKLSPRERKRLRSKPPASPLSAASWYQQSQAQLSAVLAKAQRFRANNQEQVELVLLPDEAEETAQLHYVYQPDGKRGPATYCRYDQMLAPIALEAQMGNNITIWGSEDYLSALVELADSLDMDLEQCVRTYGQLTLPAPGEDGSGWRFHPALGFSKKR